MSVPLQKPEPFSFGDTLPLAERLEAWRAGVEVCHQSELRHRGEDLRAAAEALATQYLELLAAFEQIQAQLVSAQLEIGQMAAYLADPEADSDARTLASFVRWDHDRSHREPWAVCRHEPCRQAGRFV